MRLIKGKTYYNKPWYESYRGMMDRCYRENASNFYAYGGRGIKECEECKERLQNIRPSAEAVQGWIPCSERLPDWKDMVEGVIITTENGRVSFADYCTENGTFHDVGQDVWASDIIAWMPLPTPYKGGEDE